MQAYYYDSCPVCVADFQITGFTTHNGHVESTARKYSSLSSIPNHSKFHVFQRYFLKVLAVTATVKANKKKSVHGVRDMVEFVRQSIAQKSTPGIRYWQDLATEDESKDPELHGNYEKQVEIIKSRLDRQAMLDMNRRSMNTGCAFTWRSASERKFARSLNMIHSRCKSRATGR